MKARELTLEEIAYHEAGHAIASCVLSNRKIDKISIISQSGSLGRVMFESLGNLNDERYQGKNKNKLKKNLAITCIAGAVAYKRYNGTYNYEHAKGDYDKVFGLINSIVITKDPNGDKFIKLLELTWDEAEQLIFNNWSAVEALAQILIEKKQISGDEALQIIESFVS